MGRPLNKKYFGNRNTGTTGSSDNTIGGEGIAGISWSTLGSFQGNSNVAVLTVPALPAPTLPGGVQATWEVAFEVESVFTGSGKTNLAVGDTFGVASVPGMIAKVTDLSGSNAVFSVTTTGASRGAALAVASISQDTVGITLTKIAGSGTAATFLCDIVFRVESVSITEQGSGYVGTETFTFTKPGTTSGTVPAGTIILTTTEENAIVIYADTDDSGSKIGDINRQVGSTRFKVTTADGSAICGLKSSAVNALGEMTITATDSAGGTYFVTKISSHRVTVTQGTGTQFATGTSVPWTFGSPVQDVSLQVANA
jgi:hypothetical protein